MVMAADLAYAQSERQELVESRKHALSSLPEVLHVTPWQPAGVPSDAAVLNIYAVVRP
jgi:hypothetical protein